MTDRGFLVAWIGVGLKVRRLMYQSLIWTRMLGDEARGLGAALDSQDLESAANALVDRVRRDVELGRNFLGRKVLVDQPKAIELPGAEPRNANLDVVPRCVVLSLAGPRHARNLLYCKPHDRWHDGTPERYARSPIYVKSREKASFSAFFYFGTDPGVSI
jgi:hypothetical protein